MRTEQVSEFDRFCQEIAEELAIFNDGVANCYEDYMPESIVIATLVKKRIKDLLTQHTSTTIRQELQKLFDLNVAISLPKHGTKPEVCPKIIDRVLNSGRRIRRRSSASTSFLVR